MSNSKAQLLNFTIELNRDGNVEFNLDCVDSMGMEHTLRTLGDPAYGPRIGSIVRYYFRTLSRRIKDERT